MSTNIEKGKCIVCNTTENLLDDVICESHAMENHRNVIRLQESGMNFKEAEERSISIMKARYATY